MTDPSKASTPFSFSQTSTSNGGAGFFGQSASSAPVSGSPFGSAVNAPATTGGGGLFGSTPASTAPSGSLFGAGTGGPAASSPFGSASSGTNMFGVANKQTAGSGFSFGPSTSTSTTSGGIFGSSQPVSQAGPSATSAPPAPILSTPSRPADIPAASQPSSNPFGGTPSGGILFGNKADAKDVNTTPTSKQPMLLFANSTTPAGPPPAASMGAGTGSLFSFNKPEGQSNAPSNNIFGGFAKSAGNSSPNNSSTTSSLFAPSSGPSASGNLAQASQAPSQPTNVFGAPPKPANGGTSPFGMMPPVSQSGSQIRSFDNTSQPPDAAATKPADIKSTTNGFPSFGGPSTGQPTSSASAPTLLANPSKQPSTPSSSFANSPGTTAAPSGTVKTPAAAQTPSLFGSLGAGSAASTSDTSAPSTAAPKTSFFPNLSQPQAKPTNTTTTLGSSLGPSTTSATDVFASSGKVVTSSSTTKSQSLTTPAPAGSNSTNNANLGASTSGPAPPARSRLKDKTMDDIITRWASDLSKYQKEFQTQAEKVATWDRMLVENSEKIQRLYGSTLEAERATTEVERQLTSVESDQAELESWLTHYETEVDNMIQNQIGQGEGLSGPDQERERTYQLATKLSDRLDEMGKDLGSMIEEINDTSSNLSKHTKSDDPLTQVVRVLNNHLTQLQQIDQGAANLQLKVKEAQRMGQSIGPPNGLNGPISDAAEGFYRSYMGRV